MECSAVSDCTSQLSAVERVGIEHSSLLRRSCYSSGRACAQRVLADLSQPEQPLPAQADGSVQWPVDIVGSISHTDVWALAAAARPSESDAIGIGVDLEQISPVSENVLKLIALDEERKALIQLDEEASQAIRLFSLKESIYKCLRPLFGEFIRFHDVELRALSSSAPQVVFHNRELENRFNPNKLELRWRVVAGHVLTLAWLRH